jgi:hypothetical protein
MSTCIRAPRRTADGLVPMLRSHKARSNKACDRIKIFEDLSEEQQHSSRTCLNNIIKWARRASKRAEMICGSGRAQEPDSGPCSALHQLPPTHYHCVPCTLLQPIRTRSWTWLREKVSNLGTRISRPGSRSGTCGRWCSGTAGRASGREWLRGGGRPPGCPPYNTAACRRTAG